MSRGERVIRFKSGCAMTVSVDCDWFTIPKNDREIALRVLDQILDAIERGNLDAGLDADRSVSSDASSEPSKSSIL